MHRTCMGMLRLVEMLQLPGVGAWEVSFSVHPSLEFMIPVRGSSESGGGWELGQILHAAFLALLAHA